MKIDRTNAAHIIADTGKQFVRKSDGMQMGSEIYLGYTYFIGGKKLDTPRLEVAEDFEEVDIPDEETKEVRNE